ncbi:MAG TPA: phytase [Fimbriimonadaceae bacterium]|nr:phytase [Fimbriimonadaceae bacterium]HRJ97309.1 phytase [Fimbriimonadaceae bacterium]
MLTTLILLAASTGQPAGLPSPHLLSPSLFTVAVKGDADDSALWMSPDGKVARIYGTDKVADGAIYAYDSSGAVVQVFDGVAQPNNIDVEYGLVCGAERRDILVATERGKNRLRIFSIDSGSGKLEDVTGETSCVDQPMGIGLYRRASDGRIYTVVSRKGGPKQGYLVQYELTWNPTSGKVDAKHVRFFGLFSGKDEIESIAVDDELGYVYASDEGVGTRKYLADPDAPDAGKELALFNQTGFKGDHEGIGIYAGPNGEGFIVCTDQTADNSTYFLYPRKGVPGMPHVHIAAFAFQAGLDETDGIEVTQRAFGPSFPSGIFVGMNSKGKNFAIVDWRAIEKLLPTSGL